jgi:integrase
MGRYTKREYRVGDYWLSLRGPAWCRTWYDKGSEQTRRVSLGVEDFEVAKTLLDEFFVSARMKTARGLTPDDVTLAEVFKDYYDNHASALRSGKTVKILLRHWLEFWETATVSDVKDIPRQEDFRKALFKRGLRQNSVNRVLEIGRAALNRARRRGVISHVPHIECLEVENIRPMGRALSAEELRRLYWEGSEEPHFRLYQLLAISTGARPEALTTLEWPQIDFENGLILLNPEGRRQTSKRRPVVRMPPVLRVELEKLPRDTPRVIMFRGRTLGRLVSIWEKARERAKLNGRVNAYSLRHSVASYLRLKGVPPWEVSAQLGHRLNGYSMTERYTHLDPTYLQKSCEALDGLLSAILTRPLQYRGIQTKFRSKSADGASGDRPDPLSPLRRYSDPSGNRRPRRRHLKAPVSAGAFLLDFCRTQHRMRRGKHFRKARPQKRPPPLLGRLPWMAGEMHHHSTVSMLCLARGGRIR